MTMKRTNLFKIAAALFMLNGWYSANAQNGQDPWIVEVTQAHFNMKNENGSYKEWKELEKEFHDKVIMKNEFIQGAEVLRHLYTPDNSEVLFVTAFKSWGDVEKADDRTTELIKAAWPDTSARRAFFTKQRAYYTNIHSDELYSTMDNPKFFKSYPDSNVVFVKRTTHTSWPEGGSRKEIMAMDKEYNENVTQKNDEILASYPLRHLYGSDSRDMVDFIAFKDVNTMENVSNVSNRKLIMAHWPDKTKRQEFFKKYNSYSEPWHGDAVYMNVVELHK